MTLLKRIKINISKKKIHFIFNPNSFEQIKQFKEFSDKIFQKNL